MNYRKYFQAGQRKVLTNLRGARDALIYNKIQLILYHADLECRDKLSESIYDNDNLKTLYKNNLQFHFLINEGTTRIFVLTELEEVYKRLK